MISKRIVFLVLPAVLLASCSGATADSSAEAGRVNNFEIKLVEKTVNASYRCVGDTTFGSDIALYTRAKASLQWPETLGNADIKCLQDSLLARCFGSIDAPLTVDEAMLDYVSDPVTMDDDSSLEAVDSIPATDNYDVRTLEKSINLRAVVVGSDVAVFKVDWYMYGGGAHPIYASSFVNFDVERGRVVGLYDIVKPGNDERLSQVVRNVLCEQYGVDDAAQLQDRYGISADAIDFGEHVPEFYVNEQYVTFYFNPYEIGPWATGAIEVPVPAFVLDDMLTAEAKTLLGWQ